MAAATPKKKANREQNIQVFVRVRPLNKDEKAARSCSILDTPGTREVVVKEKLTSSLTKTFNFDRVFGTNSQQQDVYRHVVGPLIKQVLQGYNCTVFAYGQTGTGKTYTMEGLGEIRGSWENDPNAGIIPRSLNDLFDGLRMSDATEWGVRVSFLELYNEEIFDLLSGHDDHSKLRLYEDGQKKGSVIIQGLEEVQVRDKKEVFKILERGSIKRQTAETKMNANSSRSHTVFTVTVFVNQQSIDGEDMLKIGKLNLVDLAGSENIGRSGAVDKRAREAGNINQSLLTLGRVITALVDRAPHIPYRESKLTRLLQDSLGGRTKTSIIATVSPAAINFEETISTLDYAHRAKNIQNKPEVNQTISKKEKLLEYHKEIDNLKAELQAARDKDGVFLPKETYEEQVKMKERQDEEIKTLTKELKAKESELENFMAMFEHTKAKLEETTVERDQTKRALDCTRSVLHKTESDKQEQVFLVKKHLETECKLSKQAELLLAVSDEATRDLDNVHNKIDRMKIIEETNFATADEFHRDYQGRHKRMESLVESHVAAQTKFCSDMRTSLGEKLDQRSEEKQQLSSTYTDTVSQLVQTMSEIERVSSDNMYKEQSWVEKLLKRMRNEADAQTQSFHTYLVEQLLTVANAILASVSNQSKTVQQLSTKVDQSLEAMNTKLDGYLGGQRKLHNQQLQSNEGFLTQFSGYNKALSSSLEAEELSTEDYRKKSMAFTEQMMALLKAQQLEEEKYLATRNASMMKNVQSLKESSETVEKSRASNLELNLKSENLAKEFENDHKSTVNKLTEIKAKAISEIETDHEVVRQATNRIKEQAEQFVNAGKDSWNNHYEKTEAELREKSDDSSEHVKDIQAKTSEIRNKMLESQSKMDNLLENHRRSDERQSLADQEQLGSKCQELSDFGNVFADQSRSMGHSLRSFVSEDLKRDKPSGQTPMRTALSFPRTIVQGTPDDLRLKKYRARRDQGSATPIKPDSNDDDADSIISTSTQATESVAEPRSFRSSNGSSTLSSANLSRQNSKEDVLKPLKMSFEEEMVPNKENNDSNNFVRPKASKLKAPDGYVNRSRSGGRSRSKPQLS